MKRNGKHFQRFFRRTLLIVIVAGRTFSTNAQDSDVGAWYMYFGNNKVSEKLNWHNEIQYRNYNFGGDLEQLLIRTGIGMNLTKGNNNLLLGYGYILSRPYVGGEKVSIAEHRIFQQFINTHKVGRVSVQNRYRLEERFVSDDFKMRFRYFLGFNVPLNNREMTSKTVYLSLYNEFFLNLDSPVFDRNRAFAALGYKINNDFRVEAGYMVQIYERTNRGQLQVGVFNVMGF
jgi:hypothetical protein